MTKGRCQVLRCNLGICKSPFTYRVPDLMIFGAGFRKRLDNQLYAWETPELIVECLSPSDRKGDLVELLEDYHSIGTPEIWVIRPEQRLVELHAKDAPIRILDNTPLRFAEAEIPLDLLWKAWDGDD